MGFALHEAGLELVHDFRYVYDVGQSPQLNRSKVSIHLNDRGTAWDPDMMRRTHEEQEAGRMVYPNWDGYCKRDKSTRIRMHPIGPRCSECGVFV